MRRMPSWAELGVCYSSLLSLTTHHYKPSVSIQLTLVMTNPWPLSRLTPMPPLRTKVKARPLQKCSSDSGIDSVPRGRLAFISSLLDVSFCVANKNGKL